MVSHLMHLFQCIIMCEFTHYRYSFEYGSVTVVMMSTEHDFTNSSKQLSALDKYLSAVDRTRTPWLIFSGHRYVRLLLWCMHEVDSCMVVLFC